MSKWILPKAIMRPFARPITGTRPPAPLLGPRARERARAGVLRVITVVAGH